MFMIVFSAIINCNGCTYTLGAGIMFDVEEIEDMKTEPKTTKTS